MSRKMHLLVAALAMGVATLATYAEAADQKWYPGITCVKEGTRGSWKRWFGTVFNDATNDGLDLICPLTRDGTSITSASVQVWARSSVGDGGIPACELHFEFASGASVFGWSELQAVATPNSPNIQTITWGAHSVAGGDYYYANCFLPKKGALGASHIARWSVTEP